QPAVGQHHRGHCCDQEQQDDPRLGQVVIGGQGRARTGGTPWSFVPGTNLGLHRPPGPTRATVAVATTTPQMSPATRTCAVTAAGASPDHTFAAPIRI